MQGRIVRCCALSAFVLCRSAGAQVAPLLNGIEGNAVTVLYADTLSDRLMVGGGFTYIDGVQISPYAVAWNGTNWSNMGCGFDWDCVTPTAIGGSPNRMSVFQTWNGNLFAGGPFQRADGDTANFIARWDGSAWNPLANGTDGPVHGIKSYSDGLYVAGWFNYADTVEARGLARWDGTQWHSVHDLPLWNNNVNGIYDVAVYNSTVYVGGNFSNGTTINDFAYYDGNQWVSPNNLGLLGAFSQVNHLRVHDSLLYIIGSFSDTPPNGVASNPGSGIVTWNGTSFNDLGGGSSYSQNPTIIDATWLNDTLYALGRFDVIGGVPCSRLAYWDGTHWCCMTAQGFWPTGMGEPVSIGTWRDSLYLGGNFIEAGGVTINRIGKWIGGNAADTCSAIVGVPEQPPTINHMFLWPNPARDQLHLANTSEAFVTISDALGGQVVAQSVHQQATISIIDLAPGCYMLQLQTAQHQLLGSARFFVE